MRLLLCSILLLVVYCLVVGLSYPKTPLAALSYLSCSAISVGCPEVKISGYAEEGYLGVKDAFEKNYVKQLERHSQLVIYHKDQRVVDLVGKSCYHSCVNDTYDKHTLQNVFSTTKVITSIIIAMLVDRGSLDYDKPVGAYWPEFSMNGKENITLMDVMKHQAGLAFTDDRDPSTDDRLPLFSTDPDYLDHIAKIIERSYPTFPREKYNSKTSYHGLTRGLILNEIVRRTDQQHRTIGRFLLDEIVDKLNADRGKKIPVEYYIGLKHSIKQYEDLPIQPHESDSVIWRVLLIGKMVVQYFLNTLPSVPLNLPSAFEDMVHHKVVYSPLIRSAETVQGAFTLTLSDMHNRPHVRSIESPSSNGQSNANSMAFIMNEVLQSQNRPIGERLIKQESVFQRLLAHGPPQYDEVIHCMIAYTEGGWGYFHGDFGPFEGFYGWHGLGGAMLIMDPTKEIALAYAPSRMETQSPWEDERTLALLKAIREATSH